MQMNRLSFTVTAFSVAAMAFAAPFKDGDTVVFLGDSITHGGRYHEFVTDFYRTRYPEAKIRFVNSGVGGDSAIGAQRRIADDVTPYNPTHVAVHFGMNDIGRGLYTATPDARQLQRREGAMSGWERNLDVLVGKVKAAVPKAELIYMTTTLYDDTAVVTNMPKGAKGWATVNQVGCNGGLAMMAGHVLNKAKSDKVLGVDLYSPLNSFLRRHQDKDTHFMVTRWDRVHPEALGHAILAWSFLKAQGVSPVVSDVAVDAASGTVKRSGNATVDAVEKRADGVSFSVLARALPMPVPPEALPYVEEFDVARTLNSEKLAVTGLTAGNYALTIDGEKVGEWTAEELAKGVSLGFNDKTPQYRQAQEVFACQAEVSARERTIRNWHYPRWFYQTRTNVDDVKAFAAWFDKNVKDKNMIFAKPVPQYLEYWPKHEEVRADLWREQETVRALAKPRRHVYALTRAGAR